MSDQSIQGVITFNQELAALSAAGLPLTFGETTDNRQLGAKPRSVESIASMLDQVNTALTLRVGRGQSMEQAVREEPLLTPNYRKALLTYLRCSDPRLALETLAFPARTQHRLARGIGTAMVYPLIILGVAYLGFLYLCLVTGPTIEGMYQQVQQTPPAAVAWFSRARDLLPIWGPGIPLFVAAITLWWNLRGSWLSWKWLPGNERYYEAIQNAHHANQLAGMLDNGCSLEDSLTTLFPPSGTRESRRQPAGTMERGEPSEIIASLPPLLRWAVEGNTGDEPLPTVLRFVAMTYERTAQRYTKIWQVIAPMIVGLILAGLLVLGYGLSLFLPVVEMLYDLASPGPGLGGV